MARGGGRGRSREESREVEKVERRLVMVRAPALVMYGRNFIDQCSISYGDGEGGCEKEGEDAT